MYYVVLAGSARYHGQDGLTYSSATKLEVGAIVRVSLKNQEVLGVTLAQTSKPSFKTKPILDVLEVPPLPKASLELMGWLSQYYPAPLGVITTQFLPKGLTVKTVADKLVIKNASKTQQPPLTSEQSQVIKTILSSNQSSFLLHGQTGSGKTRVYIELALKELARRRSVLILTPEIGLTPQLIRQFQAAVNQPVIVMHSNLTDKERRLAWLSILTNKEPLVVIGPRSALFTPIKDLGLIVIDEAHDSAYKQEQAPFYQSIRVAGKLASLHGARLVLGSATPGISDYYIASSKGLPILRMEEMAVKQRQAGASVQVIDLTDKSLFTRNPHLSDALLNAISKRLERGEQSLLFLNRRGTARQVLCHNCGWQALCPNCDLPLTYHGDNFSLRCHTCGYKTEPIASCPVCGSIDIIYKTIGTKALVDSLKKLFPRARINRFDGDSKKAERLEQHYQQVADGSIDILVGTQVLVKGLDLPRLSLVGVVSADSNLYFPDYTAQEQTFQLMSQIIGRVGRGHLSGEAIIQTYHPGALALQAAISKDWQSFYESQLKEREKFLFPPFCYLLKLTCARKSQSSAQQAATKFIKDLQKLRLPIQILGPAPSFYEKSAKGYSWQLIIKSKNRNSLIKVINTLPSGWSYNIDPNNLL